MTFSNVNDVLVVRFADGFCIWQPRMGEAAEDPFLESWLIEWAWNIRAEWMMN